MGESTDFEGSGSDMRLEDLVVRRRNRASSSGLSNESKTGWKSRGVEYVRKREIYSNTQGRKYLRGHPERVEGKSQQEEAVSQRLAVAGFLTSW